MGGLRRLDWVLKLKPEVVIVALGANDGLRGLDLGAMEEALRQILGEVRAAGKRAMPAPDWARGVRVESTERFA